MAHNNHTKPPTDEQKIDWFLDSVTEKTYDSVHANCTMNLLEGNLTFAKVIKLYTHRCFQRYPHFQVDDLDTIPKTVTNNSTHVHHNPRNHREKDEANPTMVVVAATPTPTAHALLTPPPYATTTATQKEKESVTTDKKERGRGSHPPPPPASALLKPETRVPTVVEAITTLAPATKESQTRNQRPPRPKNRQSKTSSSMRLRWNSPKPSSLFFQRAPPPPQTPTLSLGGRTQKQQSIVMRLTR
jgi:hypothetical protein